MKTNLAALVTLALLANACGSKSGGGNSESPAPDSPDKPKEISASHEISDTSIPELVNEVAPHFKNSEPISVLGPRIKALFDSYQNDSHLRMLYSNVSPSGISAGGAGGKIEDDAECGVLSHVQYIAAGFFPIDDEVRGDIANNAKNYSNDSSLFTLTSAPDFASLSYDETEKNTDKKALIRSVQAGASGDEILVATRLVRGSSNTTCVSLLNTTRQTFTSKCINVPKDLSARYETVRKETFVAGNIQTNFAVQSTKKTEHYKVSYALQQQGADLVSVTIDNRNGKIKESQFSMEYGFKELTAQLDWSQTADIGSKHCKITNLQLKL